MTLFDTTPTRFDSRLTMHARSFTSARCLSLILVLLLDGTSLAQSQLTFPEAAPRFLNNQTSVVLPTKFINNGSDRIKRR